MHTTPTQTAASTLASDSEIAALFASRTIEDNTGTAWKREGLCAQTDPDLFFPEDKSSRVPKAICARCPVRVTCLDYAIENNETQGIWGGMTAAERRRIRAARAPRRTSAA